MEDRLHHSDDIPHLRDFMDAQNSSPSLNGNGDGSSRPHQTLIDVLAQDLSDERFSGHADAEGVSQPRQVLKVS